MGSTPFWRIALPWSNMAFATCIFRFLIPEESEDVRQPAKMTERCRDMRHDDENCDTKLGPVISFLQFLIIHGHYIDISPTALSHCRAYAKIDPAYGLPWHRNAPHRLLTNATSKLHTSST
jgi:hypothetical protein